MNYLRAQILIITDITDLTTHSEEEVERTGNITKYRELDLKENICHVLPGKMKDLPVTNNTLYLPFTDAGMLYDLHNIISSTDTLGSC